MTVILLNKLDELYMRQCVMELDLQDVSYGVIIGQEAEPEKYIVIHLAKNRLDDVDESLLFEKSSAASLSAINKSELLKELEDINTRSLSTQWSSAIRMIPGSFQVLGIFAAAIDQTILHEDTFNVANQLLYDIHNILMQSKSFEEGATEREYLFLVYSLNEKEADCQSYTFTTDGTTTKTIEVKFVGEPFVWHMFTCNYELDEVFPILENTQKFNVEHHFHKTIESVSQILQASQVFIQGENINDTLTVDEYMKRRNAAVGNTKNIRQYKYMSNNHIESSIFLPLKCQIYNEGHAVNVRQYGGTIRFAGIISSRIYCAPLSTMADVRRYIRCDIIRSLVARIQIYCDGLTETNIGHEAILISEPPRRVYFHLISSYKISPVQFCEYIFRNETNASAITQAKEILDLDINLNSIIDGVETLPDDETFSDFSAEIETRLSASLSDAVRDLNHTMYMLGIIVSLLVLLLSACLHFFLNF